MICFCTPAANAGGWLTVSLCACHSCVPCAHWFFLTVFFFFPVIKEGPVSVSVLIGTDAQFHCAGTGIIIWWEVDGLASIDPNITIRGITTVVSSSSGTVKSSLTVPATSVNNGTTVRCRIFSLSGGSTFSNYANLTILPGELKYAVLYGTCMWHC